MRKTYVEIHSIHDMTQFVQLAAMVDGDVTCRKGKYTVDGKSVMGVMSIDISTGVVVEYPETATEFDEFVSQFIPELNPERA